MEPSIINATKRPCLTASLLHGEPNVPGTLSGGLFAGKGAIPAPVDNLQGSLFCRKGEASAESFRSLRYPTEELPAAMPEAAEPVAVEPAPAVREPNPAASPKCGEGRRLWLRVGPERRHRLKLAATANGQSCQAFMVGALDALLRGVAGPSGIGSTALLVVPKPAFAVDVAGVAGARVKLACWVDAERRAKTVLAAQRLGQTVQAFLLAALDKHLDRMAPGAVASRLPLSMTADAVAEPRAVKPALSGLSLLVVAGLAKGAAALADA